MSCLYEDNPDLEEKFRGCEDDAAKGNREDEQLSEEDVCRCSRRGGAGRDVTGRGWRAGQSRDAAGATSRKCNFVVREQKCKVFVGSLVAACGPALNLLHNWKV